MRWSQMYAPTLRDDPADADAASHRLLVRAGFVRQLMAGHYSLLPLAVRVRTKVVDIIREEMGRIGSQEWILPAMHPAEIWQRTGRWEVMGDEMFRLKDRKGADLALGMTHEEIFTTLAHELSSYKQLPQMWYQFQTKFRDEPRPKSGLLRVREFTMKDSYSFDLDQAGLDRSFDLHHDAYVRIFARLGIPAIPVQASSGSMGGSASVEFMSPTEAGEDLVVHCTACGYAANVEKATSALPAVQDPDGLASPEPFDTPEARTIEELARQHGVPAEGQIKTLVYVVDDRLTLVLVRGDHSLVEQKLIDATGATAVRPAQPEEIEAALGASPGSLGAVGVTGLTVLADEALRGRRAMTTGANRDGVHLRGVDVERDIAVTRWADFREVVAGETCPNCPAALEVVRTVEVGHIFKLGYKYTETLDVTVLGPDGSRIKPIMGSYGIGVERAIASVVESHHDEKGIVWPVSVAPFEVVVVPIGKNDEETTKVVEDIYEQLRADRVDVVLDDRDERPGVKFADIELVGIPYRITVGPRGLKEGVVEVVSRATGETTRVPVADAARTVAGLVAESR
ncbi:proline--tRNA ligase [Kitasatospora atroaurantiaca]|uniref:Proline--tRNA ligase n=1 Tax=Kitasatospora atroaurantiaca TaxID=285545 RepID=A0A561EPA0_9ACTN|nr:proline--tRNA ligase [Kitasatospora atroaurantiaca]TWE17417.1 prolyl-tRNA synthetase [Kitasatospora atroaurantiaca]